MLKTFENRVKGCFATGTKNTQRLVTAEKQTWRHPYDEMDRCRETRRCNEGLEGQQLERFPHEQSEKIE